MPLAEYEVKLLPIGVIYSDPKFNCRGAIERADVLSLMESIKSTRLETPILVQPIEECTIIMLPPVGVQYRVAAGNRRLKAVQCLHLDFPDDAKYTQIPAIIRVGLTDDQARALNIEENLKRKDLNILQEAQAISHWVRLGYPQETIARLISMSRSWVQIRVNLLELPPDLQEYAARGLIGQTEIKELYGLRGNVDALYERAKHIITCTLRAAKVPKMRQKRVQARAERPGRPRTRGEIEELIMHVGENVGCGFPTRLLAWAAGNVSTFEILKEIKTLCEELGKKYQPWDEDKLEHI
jgi:ParB/RepB/Spo0J family partition protein